MKPGDHPEFFRFPAPEGRSRESTIRLDRDGVFWHDGERVEHAKLAEALHEWVGRHPEDGRYILTNGYDWTYFTVEDVPFQVRAVRHDEGGLRLLLSGGHEVVPLALSVAGDGSLYAEVEVKGQRYEARFSRHAQTQLDPALEDRGGEIGVRVGDLVLVPGQRGGLAFSCAAAPWTGAADARRRTPAMPTYLTRDAFLYGRTGPWPQPSPEHPFGEAPAVLHLPSEEQRDWELHIGLRYTRDLLTQWPSAIAYSIQHRQDPIPEDGEFRRLMLDTLYTRFLNRLDAADEALFAAQLAGAGAGVTFWKMDFTAMGLVDPLPGLLVSPTITLVRQDGDRATRRIVAIAVRELVLEPTDGLSWDLAKAYALQGAAYHVLFVVHPTQHFPMDSVNAITKSAVPMEHLLFKTLFPHTRFSLVLNNAVLEGKSSVVNRHAQYTLYDPLTADADQGLRSLFAAGYAGIEGNSSYPKFDYATYATRIPDSAYGDFLAAYHAPVLEFCTTVAKAILQRSPKDEWVKNWSHYIRTWIPSFPEPALMHDADALGATMATYIWGVTVGHGVDHQSFSADIGIVNKFLRLRVPPPTTRTTAPFDIDDLYNGDDTFRAAMAEKMFFAPTRVTQLVETEYNFTSADLRAASQDFLANLRAVDGGLARRYMAVEDLPGSIQY